MKFDINGYYLPTPIRMRKIGDAIMTISTGALTYSALAVNTDFHTYFSFAGVIGLAIKTITNCFVD